MLPLFKKSDRAPLDYIRSWPIRLWIAAVMLFLYVPLLVLIAFSFNDSRRSTAWKGFTLKWYEKLWENDGLREALLNSMLIALVVTVFSIILGALMAFMFWRFKFPWKGPLEAGMSLPIVVPEICMGVAVLMFFARIEWPNDLPYPLNLSQIVIAHTTFAFPFVAIVVRARLESFNKELESAALDLGATPLQAFRDVIVPHMVPGLIAGGLLAFILSLDDFVITFFASGPGAVTFPIKIFSMVRFSVTPEVNAASTVVIVVTVLATILALRLQGDPSQEK